MKKTTRNKKILFYVILVIITCLLAETVSLGIYYVVRNKWFSYVENQSDRMTIIDATSHAKFREFGVLPVGNPPETVYEVLHPYLGFVIDPASSNKAGYSDYGFPDSDVKLYPKDPARVIIGVFGGSFAAGMSLSAEEILINALKKSPRFSDKEIKVLTVSIAGYKQPQQLLSLTYLLSLGAHFDIIVTLDGFNEVALPPVENIPKGVSPFYPRNWFGRVGAFDKTMFELLRKYLSLVEDRNGWAKLFSTAPLKCSVTANILWGGYDGVLYRKIVRTEIAALKYNIPANDYLGYKVHGPSFLYVDEDAQYDDLAKMWKTASIQMQKLAMGNESTYLHFLQPNQYLKGSKPLHAVELEKAYNKEHRYRKGVEIGYPKLIELGKELVAEGVNFYDLTMIFAEYEKPLYVDDCCHLGKEGYSIIALFIAEKIVKHFNPTSW